MIILKIGIFGARRGCAYAQAVQCSGLASVTAVCDQNTQRHEDIRKFCDEKAQFFTDFDEFIKCGIDCVILCNFFNCHAEFAIKAMKQGVSVFSETLAAVTMKECVELCRCVEETGCKYMLAENYPYLKSALEMRRLYQKGDLGDVLYGEGEYVHPMSLESYIGYTPDVMHWRAWMPSSYYLTHSLAPLMYMTNTMPLAVNAKSVYSKNINYEREGEPKKDMAAIMLCEMDNGALFRITGWAKFAAHGNWYRLACENGGAETVRGEEEKVMLSYNPWSIPEGEAETITYNSKWEVESPHAEVCGHDGSDYWVTLDFLRYLRGEKDVYFDVYKACAMAAVGILGWRSSLNNGAEYKIPNFKNEKERKQYENDDLSPFPDKNGKSNYPCTHLK